MAIRTNDMRPSAQCRTVRPLLMHTLTVHVSSNADHRSTIGKNQMHTPAEKKGGPLLLSYYERTGVIVIQYFASVS